MSVSSSNTLLADHSSTWTAAEGRRCSGSPEAGHGAESEAQGGADLSSPGLAVVQVAQVENPQQQVGKVQVLVQRLQNTQTGVTAGGGGGSEEDDGQAGQGLPLRPWR